MIALAAWQALLDGLGWVLAEVYDVVGNFGVSIIVLTVLIRLVLLPLGIKQIKSMQHMQAIQPQVKALQKKHKGNKQKIQEETMKLYRDAGVNPLGGCLPLLLQFPILIAMYSVLRAPAPTPEFESAEQTPTAFANIHYPTDSELFRDVTRHDTEGLTFAFMNLQCSLVQAGQQVPVMDTEGQESPQRLDCGDNRILNTIPYAMLLILMVGTTFYQQRQMQKASPPGAQSAQQQAILKYMPLMFAFFGLSFPAGLVLYWTTSNIFQIGQQAFLLRAGHIGPDAIERRIAEQRERAESGSTKQGFMARMMERAEQSQSDGTAEAKPAAGKDAQGNGRAAEASSKATPPASGRSSSKGSSSKGTPKGGKRRRSSPKKPPSAGGSDA